MNKMATIIFFMLGLPFAALAQGTPVTLFYNPTGWAVASDSVFASNGLPLAYNPAYDAATSSAANYVLSDYGKTGTFGPLSHVTQGNTQTWTEVNAPVDWINPTISFSAGIYAINIAQDSAALACTSNGAAAEYDVFMGPNTYDMGNNVVSAISVAYQAHPEKAPFLTQLAYLVVNGEIVLNSMSQSVTPAVCAVNHGNVFYSFSFVDRMTNQVIQYALSVANICPPGPEYQSCSFEATQTKTVWYQTGGVNAITDYPPAYKGSGSALTIVPQGASPISIPLTTPGTVTFTNLNLLPRLEALIQNNPLHLDTNISHWQLGSPTYGTSTWGDTAMTTTWNGITLAAACKRANCS